MATPSASPQPVAEPGVQAFFERGSARWDNIYDSGRKGPKEWLIDYFFHGTIQRRFEISMEELAPYEGRRFLDCGCGSGRYTTELAVRGAAEVIGLDFAQSMLDIAKASASERGVGDRCRFVQADFTQWQPESIGEKVDGTVSIGFFEYQRDVQDSFNKLAAATNGPVVISFPKAGGFRALVRKYRYAYNKCYLRFFTRAEVASLVTNSAVPIASHQIRETDREWVLIAKTA
jgi:SAM-dependent methyltransferase